MSIPSEFLSLEKIEEIAQIYGYWAIFVGILLENLGLPIPGETVTLAGGFLAGNQQLDYWLVLGDAGLGAAIGGTGGYWLGRWGGWPLLVKLGKVFRIQEERLIKIKEQFGRNAGKTVIFGRFIALLRILASPIAGITQMPYGRFMVYNVIGAFTWASLTVSLAFAAGQLISLDQLMEWFSRFALLSLLIVIIGLSIPIWLELRSTGTDPLSSSVVSPIIENEELTKHKS